VISEVIASSPTVAHCNSTGMLLNHSIPLMLCWAEAWIAETNDPNPVMIPTYEFQSVAICLMRGGMTLAPTH
jgi:hypothetical protein